MAYCNPDVQRHVVYESVAGLKFNNFAVIPGNAYCVSNEWLARIGNVPKIVFGTVRTSQGEIPKADKLAIQVFVKQRPDEVIFYSADNPSQIVYDSGNWAIQLAAFLTNWNCSETLSIQFSDSESGEVKAFEIKLDNNEQNTVSISSLQDVGDLTLPVFLSKFTGKYVNDDFGNRIVLRWTVASELNNLGFNIYRAEQEHGEYVKINSGIIKGAGTSGSSREYKYTDERIDPRAKAYFYYIEDIDFAGNSNKSKIIEVRRDIGEQKSQVAIQVLKSALLQNYPNPFNPETWIPFQLAEDTEVEIDIYDISARLVKTILLGKQNAGAYINRDKAVFWNGRNEFGEKVASGVYYYTLRAGDFFATRKMVILK